MLIFIYYFVTFLKVTEKTFPMLNLENMEATPKEQTFNCSAEMSDSSWRSSVPTFH